jgi:transposase
VILSHHGHDAIRRSQTLLSENLLIEGRSFELPYLPSYSPNFNPIEEAFSKIKDK